MIRSRRKYTPRKKDLRYRYQRNHEIQASKLVVIDSDGSNLGELTKGEAITKANAASLDLVLISPNQEVPVAKILDWSKFKYLQSKKQKKMGKSVTVKEWWFKPKIEEFDIVTKLKNVKKFLQKGGKAKVTIKYKRRASYEDMNTTMEKVLKLSDPFSELVSEVAKEGRNLSIFLKYKKNEEQEENSQVDSQEVQDNEQGQSDETKSTK